MENHTVDSVEALRERLSSYPPGTLFRGQTKNYEKDGRPSIGTSFDRHGCIPPEMLRWVNHARSILKSLLKLYDVSLEFTHAVLQHYGWRSWFVDCTMNPAVAAWFASHRYSADFAGGIFEDYQERPVFLTYLLAAYSFEPGQSHLYVLDPLLSARQCGLTDLSAISMPETRSRAEAQSAWLLGPLQDQTLPSDVFLAHISGPREVFKNFAEEEGLVDTDSLFPPPDEDPILRVLLSLPWRKAGDLDEEHLGLPVFRRSLKLPEYQRLKFKIAHPRVAFYSGTSIGEPPMGEGIVVPMEESILYGFPGKAAARFPKVTALVRKNKVVAFECSELLRHPHMLYLSTYQKGIAVLEQPDGLIALGEMIVEHPGLDLLSSGIAQPWFYEVGEDGVWKRVAHPEECDCGDRLCHERHLESLSIVESLLT